MLEGYDRFLEAAAIIADGETPDWEALESTLTSDAERDMVRRLRVIAEIRSAHAARSFVESLSGDDPSGTATDASARHLPAGSRWGSLEILQPIGRGRFGTVYRAWDPSLDRDVALKLLRRSDRPSGPSDALVVEEGRWMARVRHPNVVTIYGAQRIDGQTGLWMELVEGRTLEAELADRGPFDAAEVGKVGVELCRALTAVHQAGLVHRDVKTQNVLREASTGRVVLGDFGTGRELDEMGETAPIAGTPAYLAPEIFDGKPATPQSDLYSLGTLLFRLATKTFPIRGRSLREFRAAHADERRISIRELRPDLPARLALAIDRALDPDPGRRFTSAAAFEDAIAIVFPSPEQNRFSNVLRLAAVITVGAALTVGGLMWRSSRKQTTGGAAGGAPTPLGQAVSTRLGARSFRQISTDPELAGPGGPSPDGRFLSYVNGKTGDLAIHEIATGQRRNLTANPSPYSPGYAETSRFSADGSRLIYVWYEVGDSKTGNDNRGALRSIPVDGGESQPIWRAPEGSWLELRDWSGSDDEMLVAVGGATGNIELVVLSSSGSVLGKVDAERALHYGASLSIDGRTIAYDKPDPVTGRPAVYLAGVDGAPAARLIAGPSSSFFPIWTRDGRYVLFLSDRAGDIGLWAQPMDGLRAAGEPVRLEPSIGLAWPMMGLTSSGALFMRRAIGTRDVLVAPIDPFSHTLVAEARKLSAVGADHTGSPDWSPDGKRVAFFSQRNLQTSLAVKSIDGGTEREIVEPNLMGVARPKWMPDGHSLYFKAIRNHRPGLHRVDLDTGAISTVIDAQIGRYEVFPDNGDVLYEAERGRFVRHDARTGRQALVHEVAAGWSASRQIALDPGGNRLAYIAMRSGADGVIRVLRVVNLIDHAVTDLALQSPSDVNMQPVGWTRDGTAIFVERAPKDEPPGGCCGEVLVVDALSGQAKSTGIHVNGLMDISFSPDARHVAFDSGYPVQEAWVLENILKPLDVER